MNASSRESTRDLNLWFGLGVVLLVGVAVRLLPLSNSPYPLNDGGLFTRMADDLAANGFKIPASSSYNGETIPFAYPPLGMYALASIAAVTGIPMIEIVRWLPVIISIATIPAMYGVAAQILRSRWRGLVAAGAFALMPRSYLWLVVGGGVTRSLGFLLALLTIRQGVRLLRHRSKGDAAATAVLGGLTFLAHPQAALFLTLSLLILALFHTGGTRSVKSLPLLAASGAGAILVASPWLVSVVATHGLAPLVSAGGTALDFGAGISSLLTLHFTDTPVLDLMTAFGVLGVLLRIARRQWLVPLWLVSAVVLDPRAGTTFATVPLALSVVPIIGELLQRMSPPYRAGSLDAQPMPAMVRAYPAASVLLALLLFASLRTAARTAVDSESPLHGLQPSHVVAMGWVAENLSPAARFAVVTGRTWESDYISEWFPVIANRTSVATVQGSEWTGRDAFISRLGTYRQLQQCAREAAICVTQWLDAQPVPPRYIFIPKERLAGPLSEPDCCIGLRQTLLDSPDYAVAYDGSGATIVERSAAASP